MIRYLLRALLLAGAVSTALLDSYFFSYILSCSYLLVFALTTRRLNARIFAYFFLAYSAIAFLNISTYRGTIGASTLLTYTIFHALTLMILELFEAKPRNLNAAALRRTSSTQLLYAVHLVLIYVCVAYVYATIGPIVIRQDLRFTIPPVLEYLIKSGLALPLIWVFSADFRISVSSLVFRILPPIFPALLVGSRGTFVMVLISVSLAIFLFKQYGPEAYWRNFKSAYAKMKVYRFILLSSAILAIYAGFYIRRDGKELITTTELLTQYDFNAPRELSLSIMPLYIGLREGPGITNRIISEDLKNPTSFPLFFSELLTPLPGHQVAPGIVLAHDIYNASGNDTKYSLTPGIVGGTYIDFGYAGLLLPLFMALLLVACFNKGLHDLRFRAIYCLSAVQFFHLYHRGFLKVEYFVPYFVLFAFFLTMRRIRDTLNE